MQQPFHSDPRFIWHMSNESFIRMKWFAHSNVFANAFEVEKSIYFWNGKYILLRYESIYSWYVEVYTFDMRKYILFKSDIYRSWGASSLNDKWMSIAVNLFSKKSFLPLKVTATSLPTIRIESADNLFFNIHHDCNLSAP